MKTDTKTDTTSNPGSVAAVIAGEAHGKSSLRSPTLWLFALSIVGLGFWMLSRGDDGDAVTYVTESASRGALSVTVTATGTLQPTAQIAVGSEVSGAIEEIFVDFNDHVTRGQVIAQLNTEQLEARVVSARASLAVAEAALAQARATAEESEARSTRSIHLAEQDALSQQELETDLATVKRAIASVESAEAQVNSARGALQDAETALRKAVIRSPIDGIVLSREVDPGQTVAASFEIPVLFQLAESLERMLLHLDVDESDIGQVQEGQTATFRVDAFPGRTFDAEIVSVRFDPRTVNNVVAYETILSVANPELLLRPGMTATANILVAAITDALLVPNRALRFVPPSETNGSSAAKSDHARIWALEGGEAIPVPVKTGLSNGEFTEVLEGALDSGTEVIIDVDRPEREPSSGGLFA
jgi:HlyD family secretion protein